MAVTAALASFIAGTRYADIPDDVLALARRLILDTIGNAVGGYATDGARRILETVALLGGHEQSTVLVTGARTSVPNAVFANVSLASSLESDDTILNIGHVAHMSFYPALALAEARGGSGKGLLTAFVIAYEAAARIARAGPSMVQKPDGSVSFGSTGVGSNWVIFAAAAGAARMLGLDANGTASALGIAGFAATIPTGRRWNKPNWNHLKYYPYAFAAQSAVQGALLSENGYTGDPDIFDGEARDVKANWWAMAGFPASHPDSVVEGLGIDWLIRKAGFKPYPSCRFTHGALDGLRRILADQAIAADEIERIDVHTGKTVQVFKLNLAEVSSEADAEFSMPHVMALAALGVPIGPDWVAERFWRDPQVAALRAKVVCHVWEEANASVTRQILANDFVSFPYRVEVVARGERFEARGDYAMGDHDLPETRFGDAEVIAKFRSYTKDVLSPDAAERVIEQVTNLGQFGSIETLVSDLY